MQLDLEKSSSLFANFQLFIDNLEITYNWSQKVTNTLKALKYSKSQGNMWRAEGHKNVM